MRVKDRPVCARTCGDAGTYGGCDCHPRGVDPKTPGTLYMCADFACHRSVKTPGFCYWHEPDPVTPRNPWETVGLYQYTEDEGSQP